MDRWDAEAVRANEELGEEVARLRREWSLASQRGDKAEIERDEAVRKAGVLADDNQRLERERDYWARKDETTQAELNRFAEVQVRAEKAEWLAEKYYVQRSQAERQLRDVYDAARRALTAMGVDPDEQPEHVAAMDAMGSALDGLSPDAARSAALDEMVRAGEDSGLYDLPVDAWFEREKQPAEPARFPMCPACSTGGAVAHATNCPRLLSRPAPANRSEAPTRDKAIEAADITRHYAGDDPVAAIVDDFIHRGWLCVRDDEGGQDR